MIVYGHQQRETILDWLQERVGPLVWKKPIVEYHGRGWHMIVRENRWEVTIDDDKLHTMAMLRFG